MISFVIVGLSANLLHNLPNTTPSDVPLVTLGEGVHHIRETPHIAHARVWLTGAVAACWPPRWGGGGSEQKPQPRSARSIGFDLHGPPGAPRELLPLVRTPCAPQATGEFKTTIATIGAWALDGEIKMKLYELFVSEQPVGDLRPDIVLVVPFAPAGDEEFALSAKRRQRANEATQQLDAVGDGRAEVCDCSDEALSDGEGNDSMEEAWRLGCTTLNFGIVCSGTSAATTNSVPICDLGPCGALAHLAMLWARPHTWRTSMEQHVSNRLVR